VDCCGTRPKVQWGIFTNVQMSSCKVPVIVVRFLGNLKLREIFKKKPSNKISWKSVQWEPSCSMQADNFANAPKNVNALCGNCLSVCDKLSTTKPFDRFLLNPIKHSLWNVTKQVWVSWKPAAWQSSFSNERTYTSKGNFRFSWQIVVRFGLENLRSVPLSTYEFRVSRDSESQFILWCK
jgi:hypothetical protein